VIGVVFIVSEFESAWQIAFLCNLPLAFYFAAASHRETRAAANALAARVEALEAARPR